MSSTVAIRLQDIWASRFALLNLILKDFRVRYRNMSLGVLWSVLNPLVLLGVLSFVFTYIFQNKEQYFTVFILLGLTAYNFFSLCLAAAVTSIHDNVPLVKKVVFPRMIIPLSVVFSQLIHIVIQVCLLGIFIVGSHVPITWMYLWLIVFYFIELIFIIGLSLICSSLCVYFRDMRYLVESGVTILFWFTPIFYSLGTIHDSLPRIIYALYLCNPLAGCIEGARRAVIHAAHPDMISFSMAVVMSLLTLTIGVAVFLRAEKNFADEI